MGTPWCSLVLCGVIVYSYFEPSCRTMSTHYDTLGIQETATHEEIKSAWRELAFALHPDRNQGEESAKFVEASVAWEVLSDPGKRRTYDMQRSQPDLLGSMGRDDHPFTADVFNVLFEEAARMRGFFSEEGSRNGVSAQPVVKPHPILKKVSCPLVDAFLRPDVPVTIERWAVVDGNQVDNSTVVHVKVPILDIEGRGVVVLKGEGHSLSRRIKGDVKVAFQVFLGKGVQLLECGTVEYVSDLTLKESLTGFSLDFEHPAGKIYNISSKESVVPHGHHHVISGAGLETEGGVKGDFVLVFNVVFPTMLNSSAREAIREALA